MVRLQAIFFYDPGVRWIASLLLSLMLVACQESDGGGGDPGY